MTNDAFLQRFAILTEAPNGIAKLRELILQLAVRGKLVPQDPNDESASVLLEQIRKEKERLVAEGKAKKRKPISQTVNLEHSCLAGWIGCVLHDIAIIDMGNSPPGSSYNEHDDGLPLINGPVEFSQGHFGRTKRTKSTTAPTVVCDEGDILVCVRGATTGRTNIANFTACIGRGVARVHAPWMQDYINLLMWENGDRLLRLGTGTTFPSISYKDLACTVVHLPPYDEQSRIVAKVDRLMALCDELAAKQNQCAETHGHLIRAAHQPLTQSRDHAEFQIAWRRIHDNFDGLHTTIDSVKALRQTILQLAVQGKLVPQDPSDEPASLLLEKIKAEKERLVAEGKIKKGKALHPIDPEEMPFVLPQAWEWAPLGSLLVFGPRNGSSPRPVEYPTDVKTLKLTAITSGTFDRHQYKFLDIEIDANSHLWLEDGDILIQRANTIGYVGVSAIYRGRKREYIYPDLIMKIRAGHGVYSEFLHLVLLSSVARNHMRERATGTSGSMPKINQQTVNSIPIPVAPFEQQKKVVAKVQQLTALCDKLEAKIEANQTKAQHFAEAVVAELAA